MEENKALHNYLYGNKCKAYLIFLKINQQHLKIDETEKKELFLIDFDMRHFNSFTYRNYNLYHVYHRLVLFRSLIDSHASSDDNKWKQKNITRNQQQQQYIKKIAIANCAHYSVNLSHCNVYPRFCFNHFIF